MPLTQSAIKRARQNAVRRTRIQPYNTRMKTMMRKLQDAVKEGKKDEAQKMLPTVHKAIDMAAKKGVIHVRNASRKKSRMARLVAPATSKKK